MWRNLYLHSFYFVVHNCSFLILVRKFYSVLESHAFVAYVLAPFIQFINYITGYSVKGVIRSFSVLISFKPSLYALKIWLYEPYE